MTTLLIAHRLHLSYVEVRALPRDVYDLVLDELTREADGDPDRLEADED